MASPRLSRNEGRRFPIFLAKQEVGMAVPPISREQPIVPVDGLLPVTAL